MRHTTRRSAFCSASQPPTTHACRSCALIHLQASIVQPSPIRTHPPSTVDVLLCHASPRSWRRGNRCPRLQSSIITISQGLNDPASPHPFHSSPKDHLAFLRPHSSSPIIHHPPFLHQPSRRPILHHAPFLPHPSPIIQPSPRPLNLDNKNRRRTRELRWLQRWRSDTSTRAPTRSSPTLARCSRRASGQRSPCWI